MVARTAKEAHRCPRIESRKRRLAQLLLHGAHLAGDPREVLVDEAKDAVPSGAVGVLRVEERQPKVLPLGDLLVHPLGGETERSERVGGRARV